MSIKCERCGNTGEVEVNAPVWAGEPHQAPIDVIPCPDCQLIK